MYEFAYFIIGLTIQSICIYLIFIYISKKKINISSISILASIMVFSNKIISYFFFIPILLYLFKHEKGNRSSENLNLIYFYSVYSLFFFSVFSYLFTIIGQAILDEGLINQLYWIMNFSIIPFLPVICNIILLRLFKPNLDFLRKNQNEINQSFLLIINILLTICCTIQFTGYWIEKYLLRGDNPIRLYMIAFFIAIISTLLIYLNRKTKELDRRQIAALKDDQLAHLTAYIQQVETMYDEIRSFRHDYHNVLISLRESLNTKDLNIIETNYDTIIRKEGITVPDAQFSLAKLNNIRTLPIKGVLSNKIFQAWQKKIQVQVEIEDIIENEAIDGFDYVRIVSILLDNAIEAAEKADSPWLSIVFLNQGYPKEIKLIIDNTCSREAILMDQITEKGYSTKGDERGLGLFNIRKLLEDHSNVFLQTESNENIFRQTLIIKEQEQ